MTRTSHSTVHITLAHTGSLSKWGYHARLKASTRHRALKLAVLEQARLRGGFRAGCNYVLRKLNVLYIYNKNHKPDLARVFRGDMHWVQKLRDAKQ